MGVGVCMYGCICMCVGGLYVCGCGCGCVYVCVGWGDGCKTGQISTGYLYPLTEEGGMIVDISENSCTHLHGINSRT